MLLGGGETVCDHNCKKKRKSEQEVLTHAKDAEGQTPQLYYSDNIFTCVTLTCYQCHF